MEEAWRFGPYVLFPGRRRLECSSVEVSLGARSFELLVLLVRSAGHVVSKSELLAQVWGGVVVDESSLRVHMFTLRKALSQPPEGGGEWIVNVPLRGYTFCGQVSAAHIDSSDQGFDQPAGHPLRFFTAGQLPRGVALVGRSDELRCLAHLLAHSCLVTIVGPGGIGKTSLAIAAAREWVAKQHGIVAFVDLAAAVDQSQVLAALGAAVGVGPDLNGTVDSLRTHLAHRSTLLVLDNCEQVVDVLAATIKSLLDGAVGLVVLVTSREALRSPDEAVLKIGTLATPPAMPGLTIEQVMSFPAVELFSARAKAAGAGEFVPDQAMLLATICQQLDGIPLAIELVAARLGVLTLADLAAGLDEHMQLHSVRGRAVLARHQTLAAALDWSLALLDDVELRMFRRLAVFRGPFDLEATRCLAWDINANTDIEALTGLVAKSLVCLDPTGTAAPYRLLTITRTYAQRLLEQHGEHDVASQRHAQWIRNVMEGSVRDLAELNSLQWDCKYGHLLPDVRAGLEWTSLHPEQQALAFDLTLASAGLWFRRAQLAEYRDHLMRALAQQEGRPGKNETINNVRLALGNAMVHTEPNMERMLQLFQEACTESTMGDELWPQVQARWGMCVARLTQGAYRDAVKEAEALAAVGMLRGADPHIYQLAHRVMAVANHFAGDFASARENGNRALQVLPVRRPPKLMLQVDGWIAAQAMLAATLWIQGHHVASREACMRALREAHASGHTLSLCFAQYAVCPVLLWSGEFDQAAEQIALMLEETERRDLRYWHGWARCFSLALRLKTDGPQAAHLDLKHWSSSALIPQREMMVTVANACLDEHMLTRAKSHDGGWADAEILRCAGERAWALGELRQGEELLQMAIARAQKQGAVAWQMRAAISLARCQAASSMVTTGLDALAKALAAQPPAEEGKEALQAQSLLDDLVVRTSALTRRDGG
jgi:predicted ATPase/DNA-binding winged helix-turn-helix (wHTH) protein